MAAHTADPFGRALAEAFEGGVGRHAIERDDGYLDWLEATPYFDAAQDWPAATADALGRLRGRVLDIGCGAERRGTSTA
jgi:hypothetical protein